MSTVDASWHGTAQGYRRHKCRCVECRKAMADYRRLVTAPRQRERAADINPNDPRHGTVNGYNNLKCRCDRCRAAWAASVHEQKSRRTAAPTPAHVHGTPNGYNAYGCRCGDCTRAHSTARRTSDRPYRPRAQVRAERLQREHVREQRKTFEYWIRKSDGCWHFAKRTWRKESPRRVSYRRAHGSIPERRSIKVRCGDPRCVNPEHLYIAERVIRVSTGRTRPNFDNGEACSHGHELTPENVRVREYDGHRECIQCNRDRSKRWRDRKRLAAQ